MSTPDEQQPTTGDYQSERGATASFSAPSTPVRLTSLDRDGAAPALSGAVPHLAVPTEVSPRGARGGLIRRARQLLSARDGFAGMIVRLLKSSGLYAIASMGSPLISLILTPYLAHNLTKVDYGIFAAGVVVISLGANITQLGLGSAFFRAYNYDYTDAEDRRAVLATVVLLLLIGTIPLALLVLVASPFAASLLLGQSDLSPLILLIAGVVLVQNLAVPVMAWMRAEDRALNYSLLALTNLSVNLISTIVLVGILGLGISGALISIGVGYLAIDLLVLPRILITGRLRIRRDVALSMLAFGVPQVGSTISYWVLQVSDRELLLHISGAATTASYAVAYTLGAVLATVVINPFQLAWPTTMYAIAKRPDAGQVYAQIFRYLGYVLLLAAFALSLFSSLLLDVLFPASYESAALVIPVVALSIAFYGAYIIFNTGVSIRRWTWLATLFITVAALLNIGLNLVLIPHFAAMGAAASTLIAYIVMALICYAVNERIYPVPYEIGRFLLLAGVGSAIFAACYTAAQALGSWSRWPISIGGFILYAGLLGVLTWRGLRARGGVSAAPAVPA